MTILRAPIARLTALTAVIVSAASAAPPIAEAQVPPIHEYETVHMTILDVTSTPTPVIKVAATGANPNVGTSYDQDTEYWYGETSDVTGWESLKITSVSDAYSEIQIAGFLDTSGFDPAFSADQTVASESWTEGTYTIPGGMAGRLFKAIDPDDDETWIGLLVVKNSSDELVATVWYKTSEPVDGWVWQPENWPENDISCTLVRDGNEDPSTDPGDIEDTTWYHIVHSAS